MKVKVLRGGVKRKVKMVRWERGVKRNVKVLIGGVMCQTESKGVDWGSDVPKGK